MKKSILTLIIFICSFSSFSQEAGTYTDTRDGKTYKTVKIGNQTWMAENLAFNTDSNCWVYDNDQNNVAKYGYLYKWKVAKAVCPSGWHLPDKEEFEILINNCGSSDEAAYKALLPGGSSGFSAQFGGLSLGNGVFGDIGECAYIWSSFKLGGYYEDVETGEVQYYGSMEILEIKSSNSTASICSPCPWHSFSVRCLQNN